MRMDGGSGYRSLLWPAALLNHDDSAEMKALVFSSVPV